MIQLQYLKVGCKFACTLDVIRHVVSYIDFLFLWENTGTCFRGTCVPLEEKSFPMYVKGCTFLCCKVLLVMDTVHYTQMISMHLGFSLK